MDIYALISVLSVMYSWSLCTVMSAPTGGTPTASTATATATQGRRVRTKRCSCATFLDKECVYFCHLDIIWVNTPERVVSYGLGNAPRTRRAAAGPAGPRCGCLRENDAACLDFCGTHNHRRYEAAPAAAGGHACAGAQCKHELAADTGRIKRMESNNNKRVLPLLLRAASKARLLLEKRRVRQHHRARAWEGESTAS